MVRLARKSKPRWLVIDGCICPYAIAPYVYLVIRDAHQRASSIYRGEDAKALLHKNGKRTQAELHRMYPTLANPPGFSQHELRDSNGHPIPSWHVGVDSGSNSAADRVAIGRAAAARGWKVDHPYTRTVESHHWCMVKRPRPKNPLAYLEIVRVRRSLPRA